MLPACELRLATVRPGDEALGPTSVLLHPGTRSVVAGGACVGADCAAALAHALARRPDTPVLFVCSGSSWVASR